MNNANQHINRQEVLNSDVFNYHQFKDSLSYVMKQYQLLHVQQQHNNMATKLMHGEADNALSLLTDIKIKRIQRFLTNIQKSMNDFMI